MSYEPRLLIRKSDLEKNRENIDIRYAKLLCRKITDSNREKLKSLIDAYKELSAALNADVISFTEIELVLISPEFTAHNLAVRNLMDEFDIEYRMIL